MKTDKKSLKYRQLSKLRKQATAEGKKIVFTSGCYDLLHFGHIMHFNYCKSQGDILVVSVGNDKTIKELKGPSRPIVQEEIRIRMITALELVDFAVLSMESGIMDHDEIVKLLKPDVYVVPGTDKNLILRKSLVSKYGGKLKVCKRLPPAHLKGGISTTQIEQKLTAD